MALEGWPSWIAVWLTGDGSCVAGGLACVEDGRVKIFAAHAQASEEEGWGHLLDDNDDILAFDKALQGENVWGMACTIGQQQFLLEYSGVVSVKRTELHCVASGQGLHVVVNRDMTVLGKYSTLAGQTSDGCKASVLEFAEYLSSNGYGIRRFSVGDLVLRGGRSAVVSAAVGDSEDSYSYVCIDAATLIDDYRGKPWDPASICGIGDDDVSKASELELPAEAAREGFYEIAAAHGKAQAKDGLGLKAAAIGLPDRHLLLGVTKTAVQRFVRKVQFPQLYVRTEEWITESYGPAMTGYDFCVAIRRWMQANGYMHWSVAELMEIYWTRAESRWCTDYYTEVMEGHVGPAGRFLSHVQFQPIHDTLVMPGDVIDGLELDIDEKCYCNSKVFKVVMGQGLVYLAKEEAFKGSIQDGTLWWLDYITLRQCLKDFNADHIAKVIRLIGSTLAIEDDERTYLTRSFCIFEVAATPPGCLTFPLSSVRYLYGLSPALLQCESRKASARFKDDKEKVDRFIEENGGFDAIDEIVVNAILAAAQHG